MKKIVLFMFLGLSAIQVNALNTGNAVNVLKMDIQLAKHITTFYPGFRNIEFYQMNKINETVYKVAIEGFGNTMNLYYDKYGNFTGKKLTDNTSVSKSKNDFPVQDNFLFSVLGRLKGGC